MHCTLCLMQALHGFCLSHLTFRSEQRTQANLCFVGGRLDEEAAEFIVSGRLRDECEEKWRKRIMYRRAPMDVSASGSRPRDEILTIVV
jgi:hypothetical protein